MNRFTAVTLLLVLLGGTLLSKQNRVNDKDIAAMMNNLKSDTKDFRSVFDSSVKKTSIRNTSKENDSKALVKLFDNQVQVMQKDFKDPQKADSELPVAINTANQIDLMLHQVSFDDRTNSAWAKAKTQLSQLAAAYGLKPPTASR
jgi:hypothetical protein